VVTLRTSTNPRRGRLRACFHFDALNVSLVLVDDCRATNSSFFGSLLKDNAERFFAITEQGRC
jgi:hypothetical protein